MARELVTKYLPYVDELFTQESKKSILTNNDFSFDGAATVKLYKISTSKMNDYGRNGAATGNWSGYGAVEDLDATTETATLTKDRSFTFVIDALDQNQTGGTLAGASALARQLREVVVPEVDTYVYGKMCAGAGHKPAAVALTKDNIYGFMLSHKSACCAPTQLEDYNTHENPPGINGTLVEGRIVYDAYVFENKNKGIYYQTIPTDPEEVK